MNTKTQCKHIQYICYATKRLFCATPQIQQPYEYNEWVGLLIQNRMTSRYVPEFTVYRQSYIPPAEF